MARTSFTYDDELDEWVEDRLVPGQSKSAWIRYAVETTYAVDGILDELYEPYEYDERQDLVEEAVREKVDELKQDSS